MLVILTEVFLGFLQSFKTNAWMVPGLCCDRFFSDPFHFTIPPPTVPCCNPASHSAAMRTTKPSPLAFRFLFYSALRKSFWIHNDWYPVAELCLLPAFTLVSCSANSSTLMMEAICSSETSVDFQNGLHVVISRKIVIFVINVVRTLNPTSKMYLTWYSLLEAFRKTQFLHFLVYSSFILSFCFDPIFSFGRPTHQC
jgi:hypothetical protein